MNPLEWLRGRRRARERARFEARDTYAHGLFPVCVATHDLGLTRLFDLASVLLMLDCRPGDRVLDIGAGSGFSSEMLARFGYDVIAIDPDIQALRYNRQRPAFDASRIDGRVNVVRSLAEDLPFETGAFDGIIGLNVLHHVPDLSRAIRELARVLRPGRRAAFCEPGLKHLEMAETKRAIAEHGENDQPFDVLAFLRTARGEGFAQALLPATLHSSLRLVPIEDIDLFASGQHPHPHLNERGVLYELHQHHAFALLVREGERERTSRAPGVLRAEIAVDGIPTRLVRGHTYAGTAHIRNLGDTRWLCEPSTLGGFVTVGCKFTKDAGRVVRDNVGRSFLDADVPPNAATTVPITLTVPKDLETGPYHLRFDLVDELVCWFSDLPNNTPYTLNVSVE